MVKEVEGPMLGKGLPKGKLRGPTTIVNEWNGRGCRMRCPSGPYIEFGDRADTKRRFPQPKGHGPEGGPS